MPDFSLTELSAGAVDPRVQLAKLRAGSPVEITNLAVAFARAAKNAALTAELLFQSQALVEEGYDDGAGTAVDYQAETTSTNAESLVLIAKRLDATADDLADKTSKAQQLVDALEADLSAVAAQYGIWAGNTDASPSDNQTTTDQYLSQGRQLVLHCAARVTELVDNYQHNLRASLALLAELGYVTPADLDSGPGDTTPAGLAVPAVGTAAAVVAAWWGKTSYAEKKELIKERWQQLTKLQGLPSQVADASNRNKLTSDLALYQQKVKNLTAKLNAGKQAYQTSGGTTIQDNENFQTEQAKVKDELAEAQLNLDNAGATAKTLAQNEAALLLRYDSWGTAGEGIAVIAVGGDPDYADNVAINVPGTDNNVTEMPDPPPSEQLPPAAKVDDGLSGQVSKGTTLVDEMDEQTAGTSTDNVVIVYQGYESPDEILDATSPSYAEAAAPTLKQDLAGWAAAAAAAGNRPQVTLVAHSYGTLMSAQALVDGAQVDDYVAIGSPGMLVTNAEDLGLDPDQVWVGAADADPVVGAGGVFNVGGGTSNIVDAGELALSTIVEAMSGPDGPTAPSELPDGQPSANPYAPQSEAFGAQVFSTAGSSGHSDYFQGQSLLNIAKIATDNEEEVTLVD